MTTGVVLMNMGGPWTLDDVRPFLRALFADLDMLPAKPLLSPLLIRARLGRVTRQYAAIGGGSPLRHWTERQAAAMVAELDRISPGTAPHRAYLAFRYAEPRSDTALQAMRADGVRRAVAFPQYPHYSVTTTGSSLADLWQAVGRNGLEDAFDWTVIDRWPTHPAYVEALAEAVAEGLDGDPDTHVLFSAHSLPVRTVEQGDPYPLEIRATVRAVMARLAVPNPHSLAYQSRVGPLRWLRPSTIETVQHLARRKAKRVLVVPVAFTCDHIETLSEIDIELAEIARQAGLAELRRSPALNDRPSFTRALARIVETRIG
ncbi:ferrochelatase [Nonomuraea sediminis]|uniref:ferrochelatase n=1 Tax=Nonomuraea sediminis TaxID=2835864 RepID=UPI001BDD49CC|nr:ferrochelatase [Nonomuraea sediminis]